jgi:hypothetical protein
MVLAEASLYVFAHTASYKVSRVLEDGNHLIPIAVFVCSGCTPASCLQRQVRTGCCTLQQIDLLSSCQVLVKVPLEEEAAAKIVEPTRAQTKNTSIANTNDAPDCDFSFFHQICSYLTPKRMPFQTLVHYTIKESFTTFHSQYYS